jgi:lipoate-protein ligase A
VRALEQANVPIVRRQSGGGTVYHDLGNMNYALIMPREAFKRSIGTNLLTRALRRLHVSAHVTERNDVAIDGHKVSGRGTALS